MSIDLSHASPPSGISVTAEAETVADFAVVLDVLDRLWPQLLSTFARQDIRVVLRLVAIRAEMGAPNDPEVVTELQAALRDSGLGVFRLDPADAYLLGHHLRHAEPDPCDIRLSDGSACDGWAAQCARHGDAEVDL